MLLFRISYFLTHCTLTALFETKIYPYQTAPEEELSDQGIHVLYQPLALGRLKNDPVTL